MGKGEIAIDRVAVQESLPGTSRHFVAVQHFGRFRTEADVKPDLLLLNPPRIGCGKLSAQLIAKMMVPRIVYVSCNPSTFGPEAALFLKQGYKLERITMIDQFPNTYHIEMIAAFSLQ